MEVDYTRHFCFLIRIKSPHLDAAQISLSRNQLVHELEVLARAFDTCTVLIKCQSRTSNLAQKQPLVRFVTL